MRNSINGTVELSQAEYDDLVQSALTITSASRPAPPPGDGIVTRTVRRTVEVPVEEEVKVPVERQVRHTGTTIKTVETTKLVPQQRMRQVEETVMEVQEFQEKRTKWVWKPELVEYYETVRKSVPVKRIVEVPYTEYVAEPTVVEVAVPVDRLKNERGFRVDKVLKSRAMDIEQDIHYEMKPHRVGMGPPRLREGADHAIGLAELGTVKVGSEVFGVAPPEGLTPFDRSKGGGRDSVESRASWATRRGGQAPLSPQTVPIPPAWVCEKRSRSCTANAPCAGCTERAVRQHRVDDAALGPVYLQAGSAQLASYDGGASVARPGSARPGSARPGSAYSQSNSSDMYRRLNEAASARWAPRPATPKHRQAPAMIPSRPMTPRPVTPRSTIVRPAVQKRAGDRADEWRKNASGSGRRFHPSTNTWY